MKRFIRTALSASLSLSLAACGGSSDSTDPGTTPPGITPNVVLQGTITARSAGQITVNGVALTTPATVKIEKVEKAESELKTGMVVKVKARADDRTGQATEVEFEDAVKGKVEFKDSSTLSVGGQTVRIDDSTEFEDNVNRLGSIAVDDRVRVSGVPDDKGGLRASRIDRDAGTSNDFEVKGVVSDLSATGFTLKTSTDAALADTYTVTLTAGASIPAGVVNGGFVEVRSLGPVQAGNVIVASSISVEDRLGASQSEVHLEGIVTSGAAASFVVSGTTVTTTDATLWTGGVAADLIPGVKVEAEGVLGADGALAARKVSFRYSSKVQGVATAVTLTGGVGTLTVNGILVRVDALTDFDPRDPASSFAAGQLVELRGYLGRDGASLVATRLEKGNDDRPIIQGVVTAKDEAAGTLTILGKTISTSAVESGGFHDYDPSSGVDGASITKSAFFAAITVGETVVKGRGRDTAAFADPVLTAKEVELEGEK